MTSTPMTMTKFTMKATTRFTATIMMATTVAPALIVSACSPAPALQTPDNTVAVAIATVTQGDVAVPVVATGTFGSRDDIPLAFKIGGVIARIAVDEGQSVRRGQLLAALDLREIDAAVRKASIALEKATRDESRVQRLFGDSVATRAQWQDAVSLRDAARADYETARVNRDYAVIVAPQDGVVLQRTATAGSNVAGGSAVLLLGGSARGRVLRAGLPDRDAVRTRIGDLATVTFDALPGTAYQGRVVLVARSADPRNGTYGVEIALTGADALPAGLVGRADIAVRGGGTARFVPVDALVEADADSATVYAVSGDREPTAQAHRVQIAGLYGDRAAVTGIDSGTRVITRGAPYVTTGTRVRISTGAAATTAGLKP